jgi:hypothetical protein
MDTYEDFEHEFRPRPKWWAMVLFGLAAILLSSQIVTLLSWALENGLAWSSGWTEVVIVDLPFARDPASEFFVSPPLGAPFSHAAAITVAGFALLSIAFVFFWPTREALSSRLLIHLCALVAVMVGVIGRALSETSLLSEPGTQFPRGVAIGVLAAGVILLMIVQRRMMVILQQFWTLQRWSRRLMILVTLQIPGLTIWAILAWAHGYLSGVVAAVITLVTLLVTQMLYEPRLRHEPVQGHSLRAGAITLAIVVAITGGAALWLFGSEILGRPRAAVTWSAERGLRYQPTGEILREQLRDPESQQRHEPSIRWSRDREPEPPRQP